MKIKFFKKENNFKKKDFTFNPNLYWKLAVGGALVIVLLSSFFGYRLFTQINQEPVLSATNVGGQIPMVKKDRIEKVLNYFSAREQKSTEILNSPSPVVDPSQ
jgi:hypothetical protein